jgi:hypothetical protein
MAHFATPLVFSNERRPPNPKRPIKTGIITDVSACGTLMSNAAQIGATKKLIPIPITHIQAVAGRQLDWNQLPFASSLFTANCAIAKS